jgi:hypothetical protein
MYAPVLTGEGGSLPHQECLCRVLQVSSNFDSLVESNWVVINADQPIEAIHQQVGGSTGEEWESERAGQVQKRKDGEAGGMGRRAGS